MEFSKKHPNGIVITNPPFSKKVQFLNILEETKIDFMIILPTLSIEHPFLFDLLKNEKLYFGKNVNNFYFNDTIRKVDALWFSNVELKSYFEVINPDCVIDDRLEEYKKYDNYEAINVNRIKNIPSDYFEEIGVPITYAMKHNKELFKIVKIFKKRKLHDSIGEDPFVDGKCLFTRIIIKRK